MHGQLQKLAENVVYPLHPRGSGSQHRISHELDEHSLATTLMLTYISQLCHGTQYSRSTERCEVTMWS